MTVEALRRHRPETLGDLLETYGRELHAVAYLVLRDRADAEDVVVETLLTAFEKGGSIRDEQALRGWLIRVATNHALGVVLAGLAGPDVMPWDVIDIATLETDLLDGGDGDMPLSVATDVWLPDGWVMLKAGLGDFPWQRGLDRPVPVIVNLVTGERIELVNLPQWTGTLSVSP